MQLKHENYYIGVFAFYMYNYNLCIFINQIDEKLKQDISTIYVFTIKIAFAKTITCHSMFAEKKTIFVSQC